MSDFAPVWTRDAHQPTERNADVLLVCFSHGPLRDDPPLDAGRFGVPSAAAVDLLDVRRQERATDPAVFDGWRAEPLHAIAARDLGASVTELDNADECHIIRAELADPADLGYLQAAWALARWLCARGASVVLDGHAARFWTSEQVLAVAPDAPFDVNREVSVIFETEPAFGTDGHFVHTRGLVKLARPDVVAVCGVNDADLVAELLKQLAIGMARGLVPSATRHGVDLGDGLTLYLGAPAPEVDVERLFLNNQATLLSFEDGKHLIGVAERMRELKRG